jgi:hypothetical protein
VARNRKSGVAPKGKYAQISVEHGKAVLGETSAPEFRIWFALCLQCQHWSNGTGKLCRSVIREFHLGSQRVVTAATKKLIANKRIIRTRNHRQRVCALYGVTHLPLNVDALTKEGLSEAQIRSALQRFAECLSDTNRGSANSATTSEALNDRTDIRGSAKPSEQPLALPQGKRIGPFSTPLVLPHGNTSKNLPPPTGVAAALGAPAPVPVPPPGPPPKTARVRIRRTLSADELLRGQLPDEQVQRLKVSNA